MAEVKWIKMSTELFDNRKIKQIESLPEGNAIIVCWMKLLCLAGNVNDSGFVYFTKEIPYTEQMLSTQFNMPIATCRLALQTFEQFGMVEIIDNLLHISNWEKYQNVDKLTEIREYNRLAKQKQREKEKALKDVIDMSLTCQPCQDTDIDKDIDIDKDKRKEERNTSCQQIVNLYNSICKSYPAVKSLSDARKKGIHARMQQYSVEDFEKMFHLAEESSFLKGGNDRNWSANFDWMIKDSNMAKILDGNYNNRAAASKPKKINGFNNFTQRSYSLEELENKLISNK